VQNRQKIFALGGTAPATTSDRQVTIERLLPLASRILIAPTLSPPTRSPRPLETAPGSFLLLCWGVEIAHVYVHAFIRVGCAHDGNTELMGLVRDAR
jgi:hypothetical protein